MNTKKIKDLKIKLLEFCGFKKEDIEGNWWLDLDGEIRLPYHSMPSLVTSLDSQLKYLWPKLRELGFMIRYQYSQLRDNDTGKLISDWIYYCQLYDVSYKRGIYSFKYDIINKESPALACALAVEKLIDDLEKK